MGIDRNFVVKKGLEVGGSLIYANKDTEKVGIATTSPNYKLDIIGDLSFTGQLLTKPEVNTIGPVVGIITQSTPQLITGVNTSNFRLNDLIDDGPAGELLPNTKVIAIGVNNIQISPGHTRVSAVEGSINITISRYTYAGEDGDVLVSKGPNVGPEWRSAADISAEISANIIVEESTTSNVRYPIFSAGIGTTSININTSQLTYIPSSGNLGIGTTNPTDKLWVGGDAYIDGEVTIGSSIIAAEFIGSGSNLTGIATNIIEGIGIDIDILTPKTFKISSYRPIGRTIFVSQNGSDSNTGLSENHTKKTIKAAAAIAFPGDTIKVYPGVYIENNPITLDKNVAVEGTELRNCIVTPKYLDRDLFHVNNGCHITDLSFVGGDMTNGAAIVAFQPLLGTASDRYFDAARMIRYNLDFIASEAVGYLTSTDYKSPAFTLTSGDYTSCKDDIKDIFKAVCHDITRGGNSKCVGAGLSYYTGSTLQHIVGVKTETIDTIRYAAGIAKSCINNVLWNENYQNEFTQIIDLSMQADSSTGSNTSINSCANVVSAIYSCVGVVTTIINQGPSVLGVGINTTFPANAGLGTTAIIGITSAVYDNTSGNLTLVAPNFSVKKGDVVEIRDLTFECESSGVIGTQKYPSGKYGYLFDVIDAPNNVNYFTVNTGVSTIPHTYIGGGFVVNRAISVTNAVYQKETGITTITAPGAYVKPGQFVTLHDLEFSCSSGAGTTNLYPTGNLGYEFKVLQVIGAGTTFVVNTGVSTISHTHVPGTGVVIPPYSPGVGPITQGPYVRNCTNFVSKSIGMKVDGFHAEPADMEDIGVTGTMSVDSYTQYNQGGIGVSITNGAYAQLVSIFTICNDLAIFTGSGGQCDITNSNSSFGTKGLVSDGVSDSSTKSIYRYSGKVASNSSEGDLTVTISGIGKERPYSGQAIYFEELYYDIEGVTITNPGSGYSQPPTVTFASPTGPSEIIADAFTTIENGKVTAINMIGNGRNYRLSDNPNVVQFSAPQSGINTATGYANIRPLYYQVRSATLPSSGISTITLAQGLNNNVGIGTTVFLFRQSFQIVSSHSFEFIGAGNTIEFARPSKGGVTITENEVIKLNGGNIAYTSTDQDGNFAIGDDLIINQSTGTIRGRAFDRSILNTVTPFIIALGVK